MMRERLTMFVPWEITTRCNLQCVYCHVRGDHPGPSPLTVRDAVIAMRDWLGPTHDLNVFWTGGEPTLRPDIVTGVAADLESQGVQFGLCTNGTLLRDEWFRQAILATYKKVTVSVDSVTGPDPLRGGLDYVRLWDGLSALCCERSEAGTPIVSVAVTLSKANIESVAAICSRAAKAGVDRVEMRPLQCAPHDVEKAAFALDVDDLRHFDAILQAKEDLSDHLFVDVPPAYLDRIRSYVKRQMPSPQGCLAGRCVLFVDSAMQVHPCCSFFPREQGIPLTDALAGTPLELADRIQMIVRDSAAISCRFCLDMANVEIASRTHMLEAM